MKKVSTVLFLLASYVSFFSQTKFEKGYFINNNNERVECYIQNLDLLYNPKDFTYKLKTDNKEEKVSIENIKLFEIYEIVKYKRYTVKIDRSREIIGKFSKSRNPEFKTEQLFLKVLVEGKSNLYQYTEPNFLRFFYKNPKNSNLEQLVFKSYYKEGQNALHKNEQYKQQLLNTLTCENINRKKVTNLKYGKKSLTNFFVEYHKCLNTEYVNYTLETSKKNKVDVNISVRPRVNFSSFSINNSNSFIGPVNFDTETNVNLGIELEVVLPFNNDKWALIIEPTLLNFSSKTQSGVISDNNGVNYNSIELPFGIRHYMFLNEKEKIFLNGILVPDFSYNSEINYINNYEVETALNFGLGIGYKYNDKLIFELRAYSPRELLAWDSSVLASYKSFSLILGYTLF